jgi:broad specificity phosphatase PhoE
MSPSYTLTCIRHGETQANREGRFIGVLDQPLTDKGKQQAADTAECLKHGGFKFDQIYTSPLKRCIETAQIINAHQPVPLFIEPDLKERNYGIFEGQLMEDMQQQYPELYAEYSKNKPFVSLPQGETAHDVEKRVKDFLARVLPHAPEGSHILLVTHLNPIRAVLRLLGLADWDIYFRKFRNASVTQVKTDGKNGELLLFDIEMQDCRINS